jgi:hypothetical protein
VITRSFPPHPNPLPPGERAGPSSPPAKLRGILAHFDKKVDDSLLNTIYKERISQKRRRKK